MQNVSRKNRTLSVNVNSTIYSLTVKMFHTLLKTAKEKYEKEKKFAILAVQKGNYCEMRKDIFSNKAELEAAKMELRRKGFMVYYYRPKGEVKSNI